MKEFWNTMQLVFSVMGGWIGYFLGGYDGLLYIIVYEVELDDQWSDEEKQAIAEMQKDASCIAEYLEKEGITVIM